MKIQLHSYCNLKRVCLVMVIILWSQFLSLLLTSTGIISTYLQKLQVSIPTAQSTFTYLSLFCIYFPLFVIISILIYVRRHETPYEVLGRFNFYSILTYLLVALADVEANYLVVKAYQYTTITSIMLLDCFSIPCVMVLSILLLRVRFKWTHYVGVFLCLFGLAMLVLSDYLSKKTNTALAPTVGDTDTVNNEKSNIDSIIGDILCLLGAACYSISNVGQEYVLKRQRLSSTKPPISPMIPISSTVQTNEVTPIYSPDTPTNNYITDSKIESNDENLTSNLCENHLINQTNDNTSSTADIDEWATHEEHTRNYLDKIPTKSTIRMDNQNELLHTKSNHSNTLSLYEGQRQINSPLEIGSQMIEEEEEENNNQIMDHSGLYHDYQTGNDDSSEASDNRKKHDDIRQRQELINGVEFLAWIGFFGTIISTLQLLILEKQEIISYFDKQYSRSENLAIIGLILSFGLVMFLLYSLVPHFLRFSTATFMNLSFLSSDFYAILASIFLFKQHPHFLYYISLITTISGLILYNYQSEEKSESSKKTTKRNLQTENNIPKDSTRHNQTDT